MTDASTVEKRVPPAGSRLSLVALLSVILFLELWLNRIAARLARTLVGVADSLHRVDLPALLSFELASVLSTTMLAWGLFRIIATTGERRSLRFALAIIGGTTAALAFGGVWMRLPVRLQVYLYVSAFFLLLILVLGTLVVPVRRRTRAGIALLSAPIAMMLVANLLQRYSPPGILDPRASTLSELSGAAFVLAGLLSPWLLPPSTRRTPVASGAGAIVLCTALVLGRLDWNLVARLCGIGVGVAIPFGMWTLPLYALGAASFAYTITALIASPGTDRLRGFGVLLVCLVGLQLELPYQLASSLLGFLCLLESTTRAVPPPMSRASLDELLRRVASRLGATQVTVVGPPGRELARLTFQANDWAGQLIVERRRSLVTRVELTVGELPKRAPPLSIATRDATSLGPAAPGAVIETDDRPFDDRFLVRDHRGASTAALTTEMRARLLSAYDAGWIGVWPQRGACFRGRGLARDEDFSSLAGILCDLVQQAGT
ncbi:MAG: hypothetical protein ABI321_10620 [Polyangia bacterium]